MRWLDFSLNKKLGISFGSILMLLTLVSVISWLGFKGFGKSLDDVSFLNDLDQLMLQKEVDHLRWRGKIAEFLLDESQKELKVQTDDHKCKLGTWLYGNDRKTAEQLLSDLTPPLKRLEKAHATMHDSAKDIQQLTGNGSNNKASYKEKAMGIYNDVTIPSLAQVAEVIGDVRNVVKDAAISGNSALKSDAKKKAGMIFILAAIAISLGVLFSVIIGRGLSGVLSKAVSMANEMAQGDLTNRLDIERKDEVGVLATSLNTMAEKIGALIHSMVEEMNQLSASASELSITSENMAEGANETSERSNNVADAAEKMSGNMSSVAAASEQAATNVNMVASAVSEVTNTVTQIAKRTEEARQVTSQAVSYATSSSEKVDQLGNAANEISKVTEVITEISEQTNLLALNATIEAARAGEAGKGFAVVANEIKELAKQTAEATGEIRNKIESIQGSTNTTVSEIKQISKVINQVEQIVTDIDVAVEEQSATTAEISENVSQAAQGINEVNENVAHSSTVAEDISHDITGVSKVSEELTNSSNNVQKSAEELTDIANVLRNYVNRFKISNSQESGSTENQRQVTQRGVQPLMKWDSRIMLGVKSIDDQHKVLVDLINDLHKAMKTRSLNNVASAGAIVDELVSYTETHFKYEEGLFKKYNYAAKDEHMKIHRDLVAEVVDFQQNFKSGKATLSVELMDFLKKWLNDHIKKEDKKYLPFFKENGLN